MNAATTIETTLRELRGLGSLPVPVHSWRVEAGPDSTEHSAIWVWVTLADEHVDSKTRGELRELIRDVVGRKVEDTPWVYVRFRTASEAQDVESTR